MKTVFCRSPNIGSLLLRTALWSSWSHCGIILPDGSVVHADAYQGGVVHESWDKFSWARTRLSTKFIELPDDDAAHKFALDQIGKPYDWSGVIGIGIRRNWQADTAWFCSELVEAACVAGGRQRFENNIWRVNPQHSWMVR